MTIVMKMSDAWHCFGGAFPVRIKISEKEQYRE